MAVLVFIRSVTNHRIARHTWFNFKLQRMLSKAKKHPAGAKREIWDWDGSFYLGSIDEVNQTFNVVGNVNEASLHRDERRNFFIRVHAIIVYFKMHPLLLPWSSSHLVA